MKRLFLYFYILLAAWHPTMFSQTLSTDGDCYHFEANIMVGLNNDGWQWDMGAAYFPIQYVGLKTNIGFAGEIKEVSDWGDDDYENDHEYAERFKFTPSIVLRTPRLVNWKSQNAGFYLFAEPGFTLSPGASGSHHAKTSRWDFKCGINLQIERFIVFVGYGITNFSLYSGNPINRHGLPNNDNYITHSGFIGTAYKF